MVTTAKSTFFADEGYLIYLHWLHKGAKKYTCDVPAYALMTNNVHLLLAAQCPGLVRDLRETASLSPTLLAALGQYAQSATSAAQHQLLDALVGEWGATSGMADMQTRAARQWLHSHHKPGRGSPGAIDGAGAVQLERVLPLATR